MVSRQSVAHIQPIYYVTSAISANAATSVMQISANAIFLPLHNNSSVPDELKIISTPNII